MSASATLYNVQVNSTGGGYLCYYNNTSMHTLGGAETNIPVSRLRYNIYSGYIDPSIYVSSGIMRELVLKNTVSNMVKLTINSGLTVSSAIISSGGSLYVRDGGNCLTMTINSKGSAFFCDNINIISASSIIGNRGTCLCNDINISSGGYALYRGSNISGSNVTVNNGAILRIQNGAIVSNVIVNSGGSLAALQNDTSAYLDSQYSPIIDGLTINYGAQITIGKNATLKNITMGAGTVIEPAESASITNLNIDSNAKCDLNSGEDVTSGAKVEGSNTNAPEGTLYYMGNQLDCTISNGVVTNLGNNGAYYRIQFGSDMVISNAKVYSGCRIYGQNNCILSGGSIFTSGNIGLLESAVGYDVVMGGAGLSNVTYNIFDNASAFNTTVYNGGLLQLVSQTTSNHAYSSETTIFSGGSMRINVGNSADAITINSAGRLAIYSGSIASDIIVNSGGSLYISAGGSALGVTANEGSIIINSGYIQYNS